MQNFVLYLEILRFYKFGWGTKFGMIKFRTTDIPKFQITNINIAQDQLFDYFI